MGHPAHYHPEAKGEDPLPGGQDESELAVIQEAPLDHHIEELQAALDELDHMAWVARCRVDLPG